ncbi:hypothetical protein LTR28_002982 [Elasticomyces elasticus]|nr:hypothetical protein LTR28_002982 [Elasticomyces elasticus]
MSAYKTFARAEIRLEDLTDQDQKEGLLVRISELPKTIDPLSLDNDTWTHKNGTDREGWRGGALLWAALATLVLIVNASTFIWLMARKGPVLVNGHYVSPQLSRSSLGLAMSELYRGDCGKVKQMNVWIHLGINIMSTLLLTGSNYCMQCLSAPTRGMIDIAHGKKKWLDIGVPSLRNLSSLGWRKSIPWWLLGLSSLPLHLLYNSAFFSTISSNDYMIYFVSQDFVHGGSYNDIAFQPSDGWHDLSAIGAFQRDLSTFERLENADCISAYATNFLTSRRTLAIVTSNMTATSNYSGEVNTTAEGVLGLWGSTYWYPGPSGGTQLWYNHFGMSDHNVYDPFDWFVTQFL